MSRIYVRRGHCGSDYFEAKDSSGNSLGCTGVDRVWGVFRQSADDADKATMRRLLATSEYESTYDFVDAEELDLGGADVPRMLRNWTAFQERHHREHPDDD
ncbi:Hypothetical protein UVM_LOCUS69 [uncultured virus]|nr:Hypothetical protein UVM_LOCUS69 [uncultured virus]